MPKRSSKRRRAANRKLIVVAVAVVIAAGLGWHFYSPRPRRHAPAEKTVRIVSEAAPKLQHNPLPDQWPEKPVIAPAPIQSPPPVAVPQPGEALWRRNAVPSTAGRDKIRIAIIIDDVGMDRKHSKAVIELPGPMTMSFLPYAPDVRAQARDAHAHGHELMVHVPMEPLNPKLDPGPEVLKAGMPAAQLLHNLDDDLKAFDGYVGINNHMGSKMTQDRAGMAVVMGELKRRGLLYIDSRTIAGSVAADEAKRADLPWASRDVFLDDDEAYGAVVSSLAEVERDARKHGLAIAIGHPKEETIRALREWIPTLKAKGIELIPVSAAVHAPE